MRANQYQRRRTEVDVDARANRASDQRTSESLLPTLQDVQSTAGCVSTDAIEVTAETLQIPDAQAFGVASFYSMLSLEERTKNVVRVCDGAVCKLAGCDRARAILAKQLSDDWRVDRSSCLGLCDRAPASLVTCIPLAERDGDTTNTDGADTSESSACEDAKSSMLSRNACQAGRSTITPAGPLPLTSDGLAILSPEWFGQSPSYASPVPGETRIAMERIGDDASVPKSNYDALRTALENSQEVLAAVETSGLQGRGGAGFSTGRKWRMVAEAVGDQKYIICNADESEPATFKDRVLMEGDPHLLLEGMALAGLAVGATHGIIYVRGEYEMAAQILERAIESAVETRSLGGHVFGTSFSFSVDVHRGAGAYICGEETALLESLEGRRGEPRLRPPYPTTHGYRGCPTVVNNVETLCKVPPIVRHGGEWYRQFGTPHSPGTKLFTVTGHVQRPGAFEAPFGITLRQIIDDFVGGMRVGSTFNAALVGGAAGTIVGKESLDIPLDYASHARGVSLGSGGVLIVDETTSIVVLLGWLLKFFELESCGKCTPCREGSREVRQLVEQIVAVDRPANQVDQLKRLSQMLRLTSFCGLGQSIAWPIDSALANFAGEFGGTSCK